MRIVSHPPRLSRRRLLGLAAGGAVALGGLRPAAPAHAADVPASISPNATLRFEAVVNRMLAAMPRLGVPGAALGITADGTEAYAWLGTERIGPDARPVDADTLFQAGSVTKTYTGTALMRLVEAGMLDLDAPVRRYLPEFRVADADATAQATTRNLLTHTGGWWGDSFTDTGGGEDAIARYLREKLPNLPQLAPVGTFYGYNNSGFIVAGQLIETLTGMPYRAAMQALVFDPLGLADTTFDEGRAQSRPRAVNHLTNKDGTKVSPVQFLPRNVDAAGNISTTIGDLVRYGRFHLGDGTTANGERVLRRDTLDLMQTPTRVRVSTATTVTAAIPWLTQTLGGVRFVVHPGDTFGQHAELDLVPERGFGLAVLTNANTGGALAAVALREALGQYLGVQVPGGAAMGTGMSMSMSGPMSPMPMMPAMPAMPTGMPMGMPMTPPQPPPEVLREYTGVYRLPTATSTVRLEGDRLIVSDAVGDVSDQIPYVREMVRAEVAKNMTYPLVFAREDIAVATIEGEPIIVEFLRRPDGGVGYLRVSGRLVPKQ